MGNIRHRLTTIVVGAAFLLGGCERESAALAEARRMYWMAPDGGLAAHAGKLSAAEIEQLKTKLQKLTLPVQHGVLQQLIPSSIKPKVISNWDAGHEVDPKGPLGGIVEDYWLNTSTVLRVASAYYLPGKFYETHAESVEIIDATRAYTEEFVPPWRKPKKS